MTYISLTRTATPGELNISDSSAVHVTELHDRTSHPIARGLATPQPRIEYPVGAAVIQIAVILGLRSPAHRILGGS